MTLETLVMFLPPLGWMLWCAGDAGKPPFKKSWKREVWPLVAALAAFGKLPWWQPLVGAVAMDAAHRLPYGDDSPWYEKAGAYLATGMSVCAFGVPIWQGILVSLWYVIANVLSYRFNGFTRALVAGSVGLAQGITLALHLWR